MRKTFVVLASLFAASAAAVTWDGMPANSQQLLPIPSSRTEDLVIHAAQIQLSDLPISHASRKHPSLPFLTQNTATYRSLKTDETGPRPLLASRLSPPADDRLPSLAPTGVAFKGTDLVRQVSLFGEGQDLAPPDTQIAVGPTAVVEAVNSTMSSWSKTGQPLDVVDLNTFFDLSSGYFFTDPWTVYDPVSTRFFVSGLAFNFRADSSFIVLAVSDSSDPTQLWSTFQTDVFPGLADQPKLGVSSDKVIISWNDYAGIRFNGQETWVLEKADLLAGADTVAATVFGPDLDRFTIVPARTATATTTQYLAFMNSGPLRSTSQPTLGVIAITGTPTADNVVWTESPLQIQATAIPPYAEQPWGDLLDTNDDRALSAIWENGTLWVGANDGCRFSSDSTARACLRLIRVSTSTNPPVVLDDFDVGFPKRYVSFPALALDATGNLHFVFSMSSSKLYPSVVSSGVDVATGDLLPAVTLAAGTGPFDFNGKSQRPNRWGDYSGASTDPSDPTVVWLAGEFSAASTYEFNWGTAIGQQQAATPEDVSAPAVSRVRDAPDPFTPNEDGRADVTNIHWRVSEGAVVTDEILSPAGRVVYRVTGFVTKGSWYDSWDGRSSSGRRLPSGKYRYLITAVDAAGNSGKTAKGSISLTL